MFTSAEIRSLIKYKRKIRKKWQITHDPADKSRFNRATAVLKRKILEFKNETYSRFIADLNDKNCDHDIQKVVKPFKHPMKKNIPIRGIDGVWCRSDVGKAMAFAAHLKERFTPLPSNEDESEILQFLNAPCPMSLAIKHITPKEVRDEISIHIIHF